MRRLAGSADRSMCSGMRCTCACSIRAPGNCCANTCARSAAASHPRRGSSAAHATGTLRLLARAHKAGASIGALCDAMHERKPEAGRAPHSGRAVRWRRSTAPRLSKTPAPQRWNWACPSTVSCAAIWNAARQRR